MYDAPGFVGDLNKGLTEMWRKTVSDQYDDQKTKKLTDLRTPLETRFFTIDPESVKEPPNSPRPEVHWFANPSEPTHCLGNLRARRLCDRDATTRGFLHNEYCEYVVIRRRDRTGTLRPKRVEVTTELAEYWKMLARHDPATLQAAASEVLGDEVSLTDLYGKEPATLSPDARAEAFDAELVGNRLVPPNSRLNTERALFMRHTINGLDDLLFIVMFGAHPFVKDSPDSMETPRLDHIFTQFSSHELFCRHADPAAAQGALGLVKAGQMMAFANPLGMYIQTFSSGAFQIGGEPVPKDWVSFSRGSTDGLHQRLVFGPPDDEDIFLDDITDGDQPLEGGYQLLERMEVGPAVVAGPVDPPTAAERIVVNAQRPRDCSSDDACAHTRRLETDGGLAAKGGAGAIALRVRTGMRTLI